MGHAEVQEEVFRRLLAKQREREDRLNEIKGKRPTESKCHKCKKHLELTKEYECKHCNHWFCEEHKMPEEHNCPFTRKLYHPVPQPTKESLQFK